MKEANAQAKAPTRFGPCSVCGLETQLTFEHVPPQAAFNSESIENADMRHFFERLQRDPFGTHPDDMRRGTQRKGAGDYTLCARCNNDTGAWYVRHYVAWAQQAMRFYLAGGSSLALPFHILPGSVAKQIMCMFASACGPAMFEKNPSLRKYVLDREAVGIEDRFRLYCFMMHSNSSRSRQAGLTGMLSGPGSTHVFAEISFPPLGYILTFDSPPPAEGLTDITFFAHEYWQRDRELSMPLPLREVHSYYPGDYQTGEQWQTAVARVRK